MFEIGDKVFSPQHGAGVVENIERKRFLDAEENYYIFKFPRELKVMIPKGSEQNVGLREIISKNQARKVLTHLSQGRTRAPQDWSRRFKKNREKMRTGDVFDLAEVVKSLTLREKRSGLSAAEKRMLDQAKEILFSELVYALDVTALEVDARFEKIVNSLS